MLRADLQDVGIAGHQGDVLLHMTSVTTARPVSWRAAARMRSPSSLSPWKL